MSQTPSRFFAPSERTFREEMNLLKSAGSELARMNSDLATRLNELFEAQSRLHASVEEYRAMEEDNNAGQQRLLNKITECLDSTSGMLSGLQVAGQELLKKTDLVSGTLSGLQMAHRELLEKTNSNFGLLSEVQAADQELIAKTDAVIGGISGLYQKDFPIDVRFEREYYKDFPVCTSPETPDFQKDFLALVDGLDEESVETVVLALQRLKLIRNSKESAIALYSSEEKRAYRHLAEHFYSNILELSESCYFCHDWMLPINHFEPCVFWDKCGVPFLEHPERLADKDIIDAGAFIGDSALIFAPLTKRKVYAFDPTPVNYEWMLKTIEINALANVVPCGIALGETAGKISFSPSENSNLSCITQFESGAFSYKGEIEVPVTPLDKFVKENNLHIGLIKADVEGAESLLLKGAEETLRTQKPALLISIYHNARDFFGIKPWLESLNLGYRFKIRHPVGGTVMTEMLLIAEIQ